MTKLLKISIVVPLLLVSLLSAAELKLGFFAGVNEFITESHVWDESDLQENHLGYYYFDESGYSFLMGAQLFMGDRFQALLQYRTPRRGMSYFYSCDHAITPTIIGPNPQSVTVVRTFLSSYSSELRYYPFKIRSLSPYLGIGGELAILKVGEYLVTWSVYIDSWRLVPEFNFSELGTKILGGLILPVGILISPIEHLTVDLGLNYTFMRIDEWDVTGDIPVEQDMGGLYLKLSVAYNL